MSEGGERIEREIELKKGNSTRHLNEARKSKMAESKHWQEQAWLGNLLNIVGRKAKQENRVKDAESNLAEAETAFRRAVQLAPDQTETWITLVQFLVSIDQASKAREVLNEAASKLPAKLAPAALAEGHEFLNEPGAAELEYQKALKISPDDAKIIRIVADFYLRHRRLELATPLLQQLVDGKGQPKPEDLLWARRQLALCVASTGGYPNLQKALKLTDQNLASEKATAEDYRAKATLLSYDPSSDSKMEAIKIMERLLNNKQMSAPADRFTLAKLYLSVKNWTKARELLRTLAATSSDLQFEVMSVYISELMQHDELSDAELMLETLERAVPDHFRPLSLRAEYRVAAASRIRHWRSS